jgi:phage gp29-like protein
MADIRSGIKSIVDRLFGDDAAEALDEQQTNDARIAQLKREFAEHPTKGLTPTRLYEVIEAAEQGDLKAQSELFEDMEEKDPQIGSDMAKRRALSAELEWQIVPPDGASAQEKKAAEHAAEVFAGLEVEDLIIDLGAGIGHGWANLELTWERDGALRYIEQPVLRPHSWFRLHPDEQNTLTLRDMSATGAELWPLGWAQHRHRAKPGYIARSGLHRMLVWPYLFQNYALGDLAELLEIYGLPARIGTYPTNATNKEKATLLRAVTSLGHRAAGIIPEGMSIEFKEAADGKADLFLAMMQWCESVKAKVILGGTLTSGTGEGTNTNALGNVHERGLQSLIRSDARQYAGTINRDIIWPMALLNHGIEDRRRAPRFFLDTGETEDYKLLSESLPVFVDMGANIPRWWLHEKTRIPQATAEEIARGEVLQSRAVTQPVGSLKGIPIAALKSQPAADPDLPVVLAEQLAAQTADPLRQWIDSIRGWADEAQSLEALRDRMITAYGDLPSEQMSEVMALAFAAAEAGGRLDVADETGLADAE